MAKVNARFKKAWARKTLKELKKIIVKEIKNNCVHTYFHGEENCYLKKEDVLRAIKNA